jgi:predicted CoA-binding protein
VSEPSPEARILREYRTVAVVGISADEARPSHRVARYLKEHGYRIIPVNPREKEVLGERCYPDLCSVPGRVEVVDVFRRARRRSGCRKASSMRRRRDGRGRRGWRW